MRSLIFFLVLIGSVIGVRAAELKPIEPAVEEAVKSEKLTIIHFWAPWCLNCRAELKDPQGWAPFIAKNRDVNFIFITTWGGDDDDGRDILARYGVGPQKNFTLLMHPNTSRRDNDKVNRFLGYPLNWVPATWLFREGKLRYALNYGEVRFSMLQQMIDDSAPGKWDK